jgi:hypothetical protein
MTEMCLRNECYAPLLQLTRLELPWWVIMEAPPAGVAGARSHL